MGDDMLTRTSIVLIALLLTAAVAVSVSSLTRSESLVVLIAISLGFWYAVDLMGSGLAEALLAQ
jgi:hypothetical protein